MDIARPPLEPTAVTVAHDRARIRYAVLGASALLAGVWIAWLGAWLLGWPLDDLGIVPRHLLIGRAHHILVSADITARWLPRGDRFGKRIE